MHVSNLLTLASLTLLPAVHGYGVATVEISYHETCPNNYPPTNSVDSSESTVATRDTCTHLPAKHSFEIDAYSFLVTPITKDTTHICHALGIYSNDECVGIPLTVVPLFPWETKAKTPCIQDGYFEESVSVRLICEDKEYEHQDGAKHGGVDHDEYDKHDEDDKHDGDDKHDEKKGEKDRQQKPQTKGGFLSGLAL